MKKKILMTVMCGVMIIGSFGCSQYRQNEDGLQDKIDVGNEKDSDENKQNASDEIVEDNKDNQEVGDDTEENNDINEKKGSVYYLNFRPAQDEAWKALAEKYTEETGVEVKVVTRESGSYYSTLQTEIVSADAPTMFQINGYVGLEDWKDYCYDLSEAEITKELTSTEYSLTEGNSVYGIGYVIESYGIIVNKTLLKKAGYEISDINSFDDLKMVAEDITVRSDKLGFAAFTSAGMDLNSDWRFKTHLANLPIYFEYEKDGIKNTNVIKGTYLDNYRDIFDLYINNGTCDGADLSDMSVEDARNEFLEGEAVFYQNGTWEYSSLSQVYSDDELAIIPIYFGVGDEANQGLCTGTESYWCVNKNASKEDIQATLDFMYWCVTSEEGTETMAYDMEFNIPFKKAVESSNPLDRQDAMYTAEGKAPVTWTFTTMPSETWRNDVGEALAEYAKKQSDVNWRAVEDAFVDGWTSEY